MASSYKYCFVETCVNTSINSPKKVFIHVPPDPDVRKKWCAAAGCPAKKLKRSSYCCEDHFDLENDLENYRYWKTVGGRKRLKPGVVPRFFFNLHKLSCHSSITNNQLPPPLPSSSSSSIYQEISPNSIVKKEIIYLKSDDLDVADDDDEMNINNYDTEDYYYYHHHHHDQENSDSKPPDKSDVSIQTNLRECKTIKKDKAVQCLLLTDSSVQVKS